MKSRGNRDQSPHYTTARGTVLASRRQRWLDGGGLQRLKPVLPAATKPEVRDVRVGRIYLRRRGARPGGMRTSQFAGLPKPGSR
jgi:hypothetical protein